jgi:hypothetical protein
MTTILRSFGLLALAVAVLAACQPNPARQSDKDPIIGKYDWFVDGSSHRGITHIAYEGYIIDIYESDNPRSAGARVAGFWKLLDKQKRQYLLHWKDPWNEFTDTLVLSEDGNYLKGTNDSGRVIEGKRVRPAKASSVEPTRKTDAEYGGRGKAVLVAARGLSGGFQAKVRNNGGHFNFAFKGIGSLGSLSTSGTNLPSFKVHGIKTMFEWNGIDIPPRPKDWRYKMWPNS